MYPKTTLRYSFQSPEVVASLVPPLSVFQNTKKQRRELPIKLMYIRKRAKYITKAACLQT